MRKVHTIDFIPISFAEETLIKGGYKKHKGGFIRELDFNKRFHAYITEKCIELHIDRLDKKHWVLDWTVMQDKEGKRLRIIYRQNGDR